MSFKNKVVQRTSALASCTAFGIVLVLHIPGAVAAEPIPRQGYNCPNGYDVSGGYCLPKNSSKASIPKGGDLCPDGYDVQGGYCNPRDKNTNPAINKQGDYCPEGYNSQSGYCVKKK